MAEVSFDYYGEIYKGTLIEDEGVFNSCCMKASMYLGSITLNRVFNEKYRDLDEVKMCMCELAEIFYRELLTVKSSIDHDGRSISSEKVGDYSVSFESSETDTSKYRSEKRQVVSKYLTMLGILYSGCYVYE